MGRCGFGGLGGVSSKGPSHAGHWGHSLWTQNVRALCMQTRACAGPGLQDKQRPSKQKQPCFDSENTGSFSSGVCDLEGNSLAGHRCSQTPSCLHLNAAHTAARLGPPSQGAPRPDKSPQCALHPLLGFPSYCPCCWVSGAARVGPQATQRSGSWSPRPDRKVEGHSLPLPGNRERRLV